MNTGQARFLLADYGTWYAIDAQLTDSREIRIGDTTIRLAQRHVHSSHGGQAHIVLCIRQSDGTEDYYRKDGSYFLPGGLRWHGEFYRVATDAHAPTRDTHSRNKIQTE